MEKLYAGVILFNMFWLWLIGWNGNWFSVFVTSIMLLAVCYRNHRKNTKITKEK